MTGMMSAAKQKLNLSLGSSLDHTCTATLGSTAKAYVRLIVWCDACKHQVEPDVAALAEKYGAETTVLNLVGWLVCSECGAREVKFVLTGIPIAACKRPSRWSSTRCWNSAAHAKLCCGSTSMASIFR
jgi:hypothetical protein